MNKLKAIKHYNEIQDIKSRIRLLEQTLGAELRDVQNELTILEWDGGPHDLIPVKLCGQIEDGLKDFIAMESIRSGK